MNRRGFLRFLVAAPVGIPVAAASNCTLTDATLPGAARSNLGLAAAIELPQKEIVSAIIGSRTYVLKTYPLDAELTKEYLAWLEGYLPADHPWFERPA